MAYGQAPSDHEDMMASGQAPSEHEDMMASGQAPSDHEDIMASGQSPSDSDVDVDDEHNDDDTSDEDTDDEDGTTLFNAYFLYGRCRCTEPCSVFWRPGVDPPFEDGVLNRFSMNYSLRQVCVSSFVCDTRWRVSMCSVAASTVANDRDTQTTKP